MTMTTTVVIAIRMGLIMETHKCQALSHFFLTSELGTIRRPTSQIRKLRPGVICNLLTVPELVSEKTGFKLQPSGPDRAQDPEP